MANESRRFPQRGAQRAGVPGQTPPPQAQAAQGQEEEQGAEAQKGHEHPGELFPGAQAQGVGGGSLLAMVPGAADAIVKELKQNPPHDQGGAAGGRGVELAEAACEALVTALENVKAAAYAYHLAQQQ